MDLCFVTWIIDDGCLKTSNFDMMLLDLIGIWSIVALHSLLVEAKLAGTTFTYGKDETQHMDTDEHDDQQIWKKRSIFFDLPYWEFNTLHYNLDMMHIEKNVCDILLGTLLDLERKSQDNLKAREDLYIMKTRPELHPILL